MRVMLFCLLCFSVLLAACGATPPPTPPSTEIPTLAPPPDTTTLDDVSNILPEWASIPLRDANTGQPFTLADFAGQTVYVHLMATWCTSCRASQIRLRDEVIPQLNDDRIVFVSVDVQTQLNADTLATYTQTYDFDWAFAVAPLPFMNAMVAEFGRDASNPPSRPHFVIYPDGSFSDLVTGVSDVQSEFDLILNTHGVS